MHDYIYIVVINRLLRGTHNQSRPHMALGPNIPDPQSNSPVSLSSERHRISEKLRVIANAVLGGLHHEYELAPC